MTLNSYPPQYSSVNGDLIWVVYDANSIDPTKLNYKYVGELYINAVKVFTSKKFPDPVNNMGFFNLGSVIRDYCQAKYQDEQGQGEFAIDVVFKVKEEYNGTISAVVLTDSTRTYFNHYNGRTNDFTILAAYADKPATKRPSIIYLPEDCSRYYLPYFAESSAGFDVVLDGVTTTITPIVANTMQRINIAINATADYTAIIDGVTFTVKVVCRGLYDNYILHFINQFGGYESMYFPKASRKMHDVERKTFNQPQYRVDGSGVVTVGNRQATSFGSVFKEKLKVSTDWLTDAEYQWLCQLVVSNDIYLDDLTNVYPVVITDTNYEFKNYVQDKMTNLSVNLEFGDSYKTQSN